MSETPGESNSFHYVVSESQVMYHRTRTVNDILEMNESHAKFLWEVQTPEERERMKLLKGKIGRQ